MYKRVYYYYNNNKKFKSEEKNLFGVDQKNVVFTYMYN